MSKSILAFTPIFYPHMGGAERTVFELYSRLIRRHGYTVTLITLNTEHAPKTEVIGGIHVVRIGRNYKSKVVKYVMLQWLFLMTYVRLSFQKKIDVVHVHYGFPLSAAMLVLRFFTHKKIIISEYHFATGADISSGDQNPRYVNYIAGLVYKFAHLVLVISQDNRKFIQKTSGIDKAIVIKQGTDHLFFSPTYADAQKRKLWLGANDFLAVTTSRISPRKNLEDMIKAVHLVRSQGIRLKLLINGSVDKGYQAYEAGLQKLVCDLDMEEGIQWNGFVSDDDMRVIYASSDIFLLTSTYEGFGIANVEALASGVPVITYDTGAAKDFIVDGENGFVVASNTPEDVASSLSHILLDADTMRHMKQCARECVDKELNWDRYADINHNYISTV